MEGEVTLRSVHGVRLSPIPSLLPFPLPRRLSKFLKFDVVCIVLLNFLADKICIQHAPFELGRTKPFRREREPQSPIALSPNAISLRPTHCYKSTILLVTFKSSKLPFPSICPRVEIKLFLIFPRSSGSLTKLPN